MGKNYAKKKKSHKAAMAMMIVVVAFLCGTLAMGNEGKIREIEKQEEEIASLEKMIAAETKRTAKLEDMKVYVTTMKYVEEKAKELGLVYPDEILYKPD